MKKSVKKKLERKLNLKFSPKVKILKEDDHPSKIIGEDLNLMPLRTFDDYEKLKNTQSDFVKKYRDKIVGTLQKRDPVTFLMAEKLAQCVYYLHYLDERFPASFMATNTSAQANKMIMEQEYIKTLVTFQLVFLAEAISYVDETIEEIVSIPASRVTLPVLPLPASSYEEGTYLADPENARSEPRGKEEDSADEVNGEPADGDSGQEHQD